MGPKVEKQTTEPLPSHTLGAESRENRLSVEGDVKDSGKDLLMRSFINKVCRVYFLETHREEKFSHVNFANRFIELLKNSSLIVLDESGRYAWKCSEISNIGRFSHFDKKNVSPGVFVRGAIDRKYVAVECETGISMKKKEIDEIPLNCIFIAEDFTNPFEKEVLSSLLEGLIDIEKDESIK